MPPRTEKEVSLARKSSHLTQFSCWCHGINTWASSKRKSPLRCGVSLESSTVFTVALSDFNYGYVCSTLLSARGVRSSRTDRTIENVLDNFPKIFYIHLRFVLQCNFRCFNSSLELELSRLKNLVKTFQLHYRDFARKIAQLCVLCAMAENVGRISLRFLFELSTPRLVFQSRRGGLHFGIGISCSPGASSSLESRVHTPAVLCIEKGIENRTHN